MPSVARTAAFAAGLLVLAAGIPSAAAGIPDARPFRGVPYVGALFTGSAGVPGSHFCTASVVDSPGGNLLITSAHCLTGRVPGSVEFAPGYHRGRFPYGLLPVTAVYISRAWQVRRSIDADVAFLRVGTDIEQRTGALTLATGDPPGMSTVIGYPDGRGRPVTCTARATWQAPGRQMKFTCGGYPDGTSGGPWIIGGGLVYGVIGGYQQGGDVPWISYSPYFGAAVRALYERASRAS
jgi:hypothetical protein